MTIARFIWIGQIHFICGIFPKRMALMKTLFLRKGVLAVFLCLLLAAPGLAGTAQYTYDNLNRLVQVQYDDGTIIQYTYDAAGNRLVKEVTPPPPPPPPPTSP